MRGETVKSTLALLLLGFVVCAGPRPALAQDDSFRAARGDRIMDGVIVDETRSAPFMLSLRRLNADGEYRHICGASLLAPVPEGNDVRWELEPGHDAPLLWAVTAAHCLFNDDGERVPDESFMLAGGLSILRLPIFRSSAKPSTGLSRSASTR